MGGGVDPQKPHPAARYWRKAERKQRGVPPSQRQPACCSELRVLGAAPLAVISELKKQMFSCYTLQLRRARYAGLQRNEVWESS